MIQYDQNIHPRCKAKMTPKEALGIYKTKTEHHEEWLKNASKARIKLSLVIPFYRAGHIAWLVLESLIRQQDINFDWELIIMEENFDNSFGSARIFSYATQLKKVRCARIRYISISKWIPLSAKWYFLIRNISASSKVVAFNAADIYCSKDRLRKQYNILKEGKYNWYKISGNLVYDISLNKHVKRTFIDKTKADTCCRATTSELAKTLPLACVKTSVDGWSYNTFNRNRDIKAYYDESGLWYDTVNVNGLNNISHCRTNRILNVTPPLSTCCDSLSKHIPRVVVKKLQQAKIHIQEHKILLEKSKLKLK